MTKRTSTNLFTLERFLNEPKTNNYARAIINRPLYILSCLHALFPPPPQVWPGTENRTTWLLRIDFMYRRYLSWSQWHHDFCGALRITLKLFAKLTLHLHMMSCNDITLHLHYTTSTASSHCIYIFSTMHPKLHYITSASSSRYI